MKLSQSARTGLSVTAAVLSITAATVLSCASPTLRTAVKDSVVSVGDMLTGGLPQAAQLLLDCYAVAGVIFLLTALAAGMLWWCLSSRKAMATAAGLAPCLIPAIAGILDGAWLSTAAAIAGSVACIACLWLYAVLTKACPKIFNRETVSYIVFGVLTTVVSFVSQMLFASLGTPAWVNTIGSWICAVLFAYVVNKLFVFESHTDTKKAFFRELWLFFAARLVSLGLELVFMIITVDLLHFNEAVCKLIAQVFILIANYIFSKLIIFRKKRNTTND